MSGHRSHVVPVRVYIGVFLALMVLTAVTVWAADARGRSGTSRSPARRIMLMAREASQQPYSASPQAPPPTRRGALPMLQPRVPGPPPPSSYPTRDGAPRRITRVCGYKPDTYLTFVTTDKNGVSHTRNVTSDSQGCIPAE